MSKLSDRRMVLKYGAALPLALNSLKARGSDRKQTESPRRVIFICNSLGFYRKFFRPETKGDLASSKYLKDISLHEKLTVFENLFHPGMETSNHDSEKSFLTGAQGPESIGFENTISLDQLLVQKIGNSTRFPFLNFSIYDRGWGCSWNDRGAAIPPMHDEQKIFELLFGKEDLRKKKKQIEHDQWILKSLRNDLASISESGAATTQHTQYRILIAKMEKQLEHDRFWLEAKKPKVKNSLSEDQEFGFSTKVQNLFELAKLAFQTDSTRVITFSMDWIYGAIKVPGTTGGWHTLSHHGGRRETIESLSRIEIDILRHFNTFLTQLDSIKEGKGSLLDNTTVVLGSNFGDASNHTCNNLPIIVAGGGHRHQQHRVLKKPTSLCSLWLELLRLHDIDQGRFGSSEKSDVKLLG